MYSLYLMDVLKVCRSEILHKRVLDSLKLFQFHLHHVHHHVGLVHGYNLENMR